MTIGGTIASICSWMDSLIFGVVLFIPCRGRFMHPLAVAGLGLRYLSTNSSLIFGHPLRKPLRMALMSLDILGLHSDWWVNFTWLARVLMEWVNAATCCTAGVGGCCIVGVVVNGSVHKSVDGSLKPRKISLSL